MNRKYVVRFFTILVVCGLSIQSAEASRFCARVFEAQVQSIEQLLGAETRPTADDILGFSKAEKRKFFENTQKPDEPQVFSVIADVAREVVNNWDGRPIILLGRDCELIYDALQYLFFASGTPQSVIDRVSLVTLSRPMMDNSNYGQLRTYFKKNASIDLNEIIQGKQKIRIFDTGNRGTIYLKLLNLFLGQIKSNDTEWKSKILNVLQSIDFLLLATEDRSTLVSVIKTIEGMKKFDRQELYDLFDREEDNLYFPQIVVPASEARRFLPTNLDNRYDWVVDNIEYKPHWEGRTLSLSKGGRNRELPLEPDKRVDKTKYLARQIALLEYMEKSEEVQEIVNDFAKKSGRVVEVTGSKLAAVPPTPAAQEPEKPVVPVKKTGASKTTYDASKFVMPQQFVSMFGMEPKTEPKPLAKPRTVVRPSVEVAPQPQPRRRSLAVGQAYEKGDVLTLNGQDFTVETKLGSGSRGVVYQVRGSNRTDYALKIAKYDDEETLDSFSREQRKQADYVQAGAAHSQVVELGTIWILKTLVLGQRADAWLKEWDWDRNPDGGPKMTALIRFFQGIAARGIYIGDLNPTNLVWSGNQWVIVDSGGARLNYGESKALKRFYEKTKDRWYDYFPSREARRAFKEALGRGLIGQSE